MMRDDRVARRRRSGRAAHVQTAIVMALAAMPVWGADAPAKTKSAKPTTRPADPTTCPVGPRSAKVEPWQPLFRGVDGTSASTQTPRPLHAYAVRIDMTDPTIEFFVTPSNGDEPLDTNGLKTSSFLTKYKCQVAINATPYSPLVGREGQPTDILGLSISRGDPYSPQNDTYGALLITRNNKAWIATPPIRTKRAHNAVGGFRLLLKDGQNVGWDDVLHPRSAAGISKDGKYLYLVVIDGRQKGYSEGTTTGETAEWMRRFGAWNALNLDGGGSSALVVDDGRGGAKVLNRPIQMGIPGNERINGNALGVFAKPRE